MKLDKIVELRNGNVAHNHHRHVEFTRHALHRMLERVPHLSVRDLASMVSGAMMKDWTYVPEWFSIRSWSKRYDDRFVICDDMVIVVAADKGRGHRRVVKTIITRECGE